MLVTNVEETEEKTIKEPLPKDDVTSQHAEEKVAPSSTTVSRVVQPEQAEKTREERTRAKSAPEVASDEKDQSPDGKMTKNTVLDGGEDMTDEGVQRKRRRSSQKDGRSGSLKVNTIHAHWAYTIV